MLAIDTFLISFNVGSVGFCEPVKIHYRTEELLPYLKYPSEDLDKKDLHYQSAIKQIELSLGVKPTEIIDIIRI